MSLFGLGIERLWLFAFAVMLLALAIPELRPYLPIIVAALVALPEALPRPGARSR